MNPGDNDPWLLIKGILPLVIALIVGIATVLLASLVLPVLLPVAVVGLILGLGYLWLKSGLGRPGGPPRYYD